MRKIYMVSGNKGGCGKSFFCLSLIQYLKMTGQNFSVVETDDGNPDVGLACASDGITTKTVDLLGEEPLSDLINAVDGMDTEIVVINAAGGDNRTLDRIAVFYEALSEIADEIRVFWVVLSEQAGVIALQEYLDATKIDLSKITVIMNLLLTKYVENFAFSQSPLRNQILAAGGSDMVMPLMSRQLADFIRDSHMTLDTSSKMTLVNRLCIQAFMKEISKGLEKVGI